jgi:hypothetical protein
MQKCVLQMERARVLIVMFADEESRYEDTHPGGAD